MRTLRIMTPPLALLVALPALAQAPAPGAPPPAPASAPSTAPAPEGVGPVAAPPPNEAAPNGAAQSSGDVSVRLGAGTADPDAAPSAGSEGAVGTELDAAAAIEGSVPAEQRTGFTTGLRLGVGVPFGKAGQNILGDERDLSDLTSWRAPVWIDVGYTFSGSLTVGAYAQVGVGGNGDSCDGDCDWSDIRVGASAEWRFVPGAAVDPWLGVGFGYEWLSYRVLVSAEIEDESGELQSVQGRATERFGGPELMLHGGIDFQVEEALRIGPYASATVSQYLTDSYSCQPSTDLCPPDGSIDGAAFHSWIGVGLRGAYTP